MSDANDRMPSGAQRKLDAFIAASAPKKLPYYEVLGVSESATQDDIIRAYRKLSLKVHPDKPGGSNAKFQELSKAYKCLKDDDARRKYDDCGFDEDNLEDTTEVDEFVNAFFGEGARNIDGRSPDWKTNSVENYNPINLEQVPLHMKDIVRVGLNYIVSLDHIFENVVLLQHGRIDILYLMVGLFDAGGLTQEVFESDRSYPITYYDNPLQPGIQPRWSDQNVLGGTRLKKKDVPRKELTFEEFQRRQKIALAMLENEAPDPMAALEEKYRNKMYAQLHQTKCLTERNKVEAIRGQAIYEDDAELDCNAYANFLGHEKDQRNVSTALKSESSAQSSNQTPESALRASAAALDKCGGDFRGFDELAIESMLKDEEAKIETSTLACESIGRDDILGLSSDGVLFVAKGGKVLRNEGPTRPTSKDSSQTMTVDVESKLITTIPWYSRFVECHPLLGCMCGT
mmetsp:Transcript_28696/g.46203  ORF Transcript_28696/g.46203 Transcript_28696/m.46203 type:complete len:458 (+) Transcript_28696:85-1458(+)